MTSSDGITWTSSTSAADNSWNSVTYGNGLFVAVANTGTGNRVMTSADGINWISRNAAADNAWRSVTYGNGLFVAVANTGTGNRLMTSADGINWTSRNAAAQNDWRIVTYGNGLFVAVAQSGTGNRVMTSVDGETWTSRNSAADNAWFGVTYGNGLFVAVAVTGSGNRVMTSSYNTAADAPVISSAPVSQSQATVSFTQSTSAFAPAITNYRYSIDGGSSWTNLSPAATTSPITVAGLTDFTNQIQLQAVNSVGNSCPASYSLALVAVNLDKYGQQSSIPSEFVNKNGARGISGIRATGESRINTPLLSATAAVTSITTTTATSGGTVSADGGDPVTARGVCYSTTANPTIADNKTVDGTGIGTFTSAMTGLASGTTYYVRSYATNSMGTTYGPEINFTTIR
jgi:predicted RecA/RadA family phage recombinase